MDTDRLSRLNSDLWRSLSGECLRGRLPRIRAALEAGADPNAQEAQSPPGWTALHRACAREPVDIDPEVMPLLLRYHANIFLPDKRGFTPILLAARAGHVGHVRLLLEAGASLMDHDATRQRWGALHHAALSGNPECVRLFLEKGLDAHELCPRDLVDLLDDEKRSRRAITDAGQGICRQLTPIDVARREHHTSCLDVFASYSTARLLRDFERDPDCAP